MNSAVLDLGGIADTGCMGLMVGVRGDLTHRAVDQLRHWPSVKVSAGPGVTVVEIVPDGPHLLYLYDDDHAELDLTWPVAERLRHVFQGCKPVSISAGHDWIGVRLDAPRDVDLLLALLSVALKAHIAPAGAE